MIWNGSTILTTTSNNKTTSYEYDSLQQLTRENNPIADSTWVYTYDAGGNILTKKQYDYTTGTLGSLESTINYTYGDTQWRDKLTKWNGKTFSYDAIGNLTSDGTWTYTWEHGRQLSGMSKSGTSISYTYAPDGMRRTKTVGSTAYSYYYNGSLLTHMYKGNQYVHITYDASGNPISMYYSPDGGTYYYVLNQQGDVIGLVNSSGAMVVEYTYDAWGKPITTTGSKATTVGALNPLRYRGYIYDTETGLFYVSSRYYNPEVGRFINADGYVSTGQGVLGTNMFAYCSNNPVMRSDPSGENWIRDLLELRKAYLQKKKEEAQKKDNFTRTKGVSLSGGMGGSGSLSFGYTKDSHGNYGIVFSGSAGGGTPSWSLVGYKSYNNAPDIWAQSGMGTQIGGSVAIGASVGVDHNILIDRQNNATYQGVTVNAGIGASAVIAEMHGEISYSYVWGFNRYDVELAVIDWILQDD